MSAPLKTALARAVRGGLLRRLRPLELRALVYFLSRPGECDATVAEIAKAIGTASAYRARRAVDRLEARGLVETTQVSGGRVATRRRLTLGSGEEERTATLG